MQDDKLGLVLGGGGARGLCHIGVWRVLQELDIRPDVLAGTSMGGLIGAIIAAGHGADEMEQIARDVDWRRMINWGLTGRLLSGTRFRDWLGRYVPETFEELQVPLVLTATDVVDGRIRYLHTGDLITAIQATTAYPGALESVSLGESILVDGGILNQIPVDGARFLGARRIIAVNATPLETLENPAEAVQLSTRRSAAGALREAMRAIDIMQSQLTMVRLSLYQPDVLIDPRIEGVEITDFHKAALAIAAGESAARDRADKLRELTDRRG
ncbi:patatin-like phospholipase family protein [Ammonicoccus fulvus]|uniref:Patatin-like phospholipase family protein n=1 Tax=Ammonicoccus fulvus TaxID=3138240 RepID=A0ABZ3FTT0_9ACTN